MHSYTIYLRFSQN